MNTFVRAVNNTPKFASTANGALTLATSGNANVDFFAAVGSLRARPADAKKLFTAAFNENPELALRIVAWARDIREGAGERAIPRLLMSMFDADPKFDAYAEKFISLIPVLGRWDDLLIFVGTRYQSAAFNLIRAALFARDGLAAKWMPRKGPEAIALRNFLGMSPKAYRKLLVSLSNTVEQDMCSKNWKEIDYSKLPSRAAHIYQKAFWRNDKERYGRYVEALRAKLAGKPVVDKEFKNAKINASVMYPHEIVAPQLSAYNRAPPLSSEKMTLMLSQWAALKNFLADSEGSSILPIVDVSGSMFNQTSMQDTKIRPIDVAVGLGVYIADKQKGPFKDMVVNFSDRSEIVTLSGTLIDKINKIRNMPWGGSTNIQAAFSNILHVAVKNRVRPEDMPKTIIVISDMEFNSCVVGLNFDGIRVKYAAAGYDLPQIVFWNVCGRVGNVPASAKTRGVALFSGFSPSLMTTILGMKQPTKQDAIDAMMKTVMVPRYDFMSIDVPPVKAVLAKKVQKRVEVGSPKAYGLR